MTLLTRVRSRPSAEATMIRSAGSASKTKPRARKAGVLRGSVIQLNHRVAGSLGRADIAIAVGLQTRRADRSPDQSHDGQMAAANDGESERIAVQALELAGE